MIFGSKKCGIRKNVYLDIEHPQKEDCNLVRQKCGIRIFVHLKTRWFYGNPKRYIFE